MTREGAELRAFELEGYTVEGGIITSPGKFEGEPEYARHFYDVSLGEADVQEDGVYRIGIEPEDRDAYPTLPEDATHVDVFEDDQGFVHVSLVTVSSAVW